MNLLWETSTKYLLHIKLTHRNVKTTVELACFQQTNVNLGTLLVIDNVADLLPGYEGHNSPLLCAAVLDSVHHGHLDSVVNSRKYIHCIILPKYSIEKNIHSIINGKYSIDNISIVMKRQQSPTVRSIWRNHHHVSVVSTVVAATENLSTFVQ